MEKMFRNIPEDMVETAGEVSRLGYIEKLWNIIPENPCYQENHTHKNAVMRGNIMKFSCIYPK